MEWDGMGWKDLFDVGLSASLERSDCSPQDVQKTRLASQSTQKLEINTKHLMFHYEKSQI